MSNLATGYYGQQGLGADLPPGNGLSREVICRIPKITVVHSQSCFWAMEDFALSCGPKREMVIVAAATDCSPGFGRDTLIGCKLLINNNKLPSSVLEWQVHLKAVGNL